MGKYGKGVYGGLSSILKDKCRKLAFQQVVPQVVDRENESQIVGDGKEDETMKMLEENQKPMKKENVNVMEEDCVPEGKWEMISEVKKEFEFSERYGNNLKNNFLKSAIWSPDGLCLLVNSQDNCLRMFNFNTNNWTELKRNSNSSLPLLDIIFRYYPFGPVRDMKWYPKMDSNNPSTCFFVVTTPDKPVYVYDAYSTQIKCNLISNNHLNEIRSTYTMSFNHDNLLCCGHDKCLSIFDLHQPQYPIEEKNLKIF
ncbi:hypothetical protein SNEBB_000937 [Seison nebaliae]|nr:hypothetical protein SNEBB_000937 [Seison nebaliae]